MKKTQLVFIHGGTTFKKRSDYLTFLKNRDIYLEKYETWSGEYLDKNLSSHFEIIRPKMPCKENAKYEEWKIYFENLLTVLKKELVLVGNSLGAIFLVKYLSENKVNKTIQAIYLVAPPFDDNLPSEDLAGGFRLKNDLSLLEKQTKNLSLFFSEDDDIVPSKEADKYKEKLNQANFFLFAGMKGHFRCEEFPQLINIINKDLKFNK